jgi:ADP-ribose pyrophosphatase
VKPIKTEVAFETPWFQVVAKTMREEEPPYYSLRLPDYASLLGLTEEGKVLVVRQYRPALERYTIELPSGIVDPGESPAETAGRELLEETGYAASDVEVLGAMDPDGGRLSNRIWGCFSGRLKRIPGHPPEPGIEVIEWTIDELYQACNRGPFDHALHVAIVLQALLQGKLPPPAPVLT